MLGTLHRAHLDASLRYSLVDLRAQILALAPDLVCGEVAPDEWDRDLEGGTSPESAVVFEAARTLGAPFEPVDVGAARDRSWGRPRPLAPEALQALRRQDPGASAFDLWHLARFSSLARELESSLHEPWPDGRAEQVVAQCLAAANRLSARRVLFVFGAGHKGQLEAALNKAGVQGLPMERRFRPSKDPVSGPVVARWKRNEDRLRRAAQDPDPQLRRRIEAGGWLEGLHAFIASEGRPSELAP